MGIRQFRKLTAYCLLCAMWLAVPALDVQAQNNGRLTVDFNLDLELVADGFRLPVFLTHAGDGSNRMFVVEKAGRIAILQNGKRLERYFMDISPLVRSTGSEQGLLGLAFHPNYETNGYFFVYYTNTDAKQVVVRYTVSASDPNVADLGSAKQVLYMDDRYANHNGGMLAFGPDGNLWIGTGDGGGAGDPLRSGQDTRTLLGKILRINVDEVPYTIPPDNPFADGQRGLPEIWSFGWRNPWRFSFDRATGDLYIADVGQNAYEEVNVEKAGTRGGLNYGWNVMEGFHCYRGNNCDPSNYVLPVAEYDHGLGISITGGYVYRGAAFPRMQGTYFYGDYGTSRVWAMRETQPGRWDTAEVLQPGYAISSFGEDEAGEVYLLDYGRGGIYRLVDRQ